jgi:2-keto-4-pentenoate hydratase/2-oxohepta-3-ene-1,7-dioic acid hydratase in catechol pathway
MKLVSFARAGRAAYGVLLGDRIVDCSAVGDGAYPTLRSAVAAGALEEIAHLAATGQPNVVAADVVFLPPIPDPEKIICIGLNYRDHAAETSQTVQANPEVFIRMRNTLVGHGSPLVIPKVSSQLDYEGELAIVIGKPGRYISEADAIEHVLGYACFNDGSVRDFQFAHCISVGKNFPGTGGFGPWILTQDEMPKPGEHVLSTRVNGTELQRSGLDMLIRDVAATVAYVSNFTQLEAGDVIPTGTPKGVGFVRKPQIFLKPGDIVEVEVSGLGTLRHPVVAET